MIQRLYACGYALLVMLSACPAQTNIDPHWERVGPGGGGATFIPTFSYTDRNEFLLRCDMTGTYQTTDGGQHYRQINFPNGAHSFAFHPANDKVIYLGSSALYRTKDGGIHWEQVYPKPGQVFGYSFTGDHAELQSPLSPINSIRLDSNGIYFTADHSLFYSPDGGQSWMTKDLHSPLLYLYVTPATIYSFSSDSVYSMNKYTGSIKRSPLPAAMQPVSSFAAGRSKETGANLLYALHRDSSLTAIWVCPYPGDTWIRTAFPLTAEATKIACSEFDASKAYVITDRLQETPTRTWYGVWKTDDAGLHWHWVLKAGGGTSQYGVADGKNPSNLQDGWAGRAFGKEYAQLMDLGVNPNNGNIAIATDWYRVMQTTDGGKTWKGIYSHTNQDGSVSSTGLDVTTTYGVHFDPYDHRHIAISCTDIGYHHSFDGGRSWIRSIQGVPKQWVNTCYWAIFDPAVKGRVWSAWSGMHDIPRGKMTRDPHWKEHCKGGICVSTDGGRSWSPLIKGMDDNSPATCIILDSTSPVKNRTLYATVYNKGVFKSVDGGKTWTLKNKGLDDNTCAFKITRAGNGDLYLVVTPTPDFNSGHTQVQSSPLRFHSGAVYKSVDGAASWSKLTLTEGEALFPSGVTVDPSNPQRIYVACWSDITLSDLFGGAATKAAGGDKLIPMPGGIFMSEDGGQHWTSIFDKRNYVYDVTVDPHHPGRIYCNTFTGAAWRSNDYGSTWDKIDGYDFHWGHRVIVDENDPERLYLTTYGSGVWHTRRPI